MLKQIAWNTFKNTGNINTMMELIEVDKAMENKMIINEQKMNDLNTKINSNGVTLK